MEKTLLCSLLLILSLQASAYSGFFDNTINDDTNYYDYSEPDERPEPIDIPIPPVEKIEPPQTIEPPLEPAAPFEEPEPQDITQDEPEIKGGGFDPFNFGGNIPTPTPRPDPPARPAPPKYAGRKSEVRRQCNITNYHGYSSSRGLTGGDTAKTMGCDDHFTIGPDLHTAQMYIVSNEFRDFLRAHMLTCTNEALRRSGIEGKATAVHLSMKDERNGHTIGGIYSYRKSNNGKLSIHAAGRAIDVVTLKIFLDNGETYQYPMNVSKRDKNFYNDFNNCWRKKIAATCPNAGWAKNTTDGCGVIDAHDNRAHHNHVHIALPFCGREIPGMNTW